MSAGDERAAGSGKGTDATATAGRTGTVDDAGGAAVRPVFQLPPDLPDGRAIAASTHNRQCLGYSCRLVDLLAARDCRCDVYLGGKLNAILEGDTEPSDAGGLLREIGVLPCRNVPELVEQAARV